MLYSTILTFLCCVSAAMETYSDCSQGVEVITDSTAQITSPNFPGKYNANLSCHWRLYSDSKIKLRLLHLNNLVAEGDSPADKGNGCADKLQIFIDGDPDVFTPNEFCAVEVNDLPKKDFTIRRADRDNLTVDIVFTSDGHDEGTGFSIRSETGDVPIRNCNYTRLGILCQRWDGEYPHKPIHRPPANDRAHNFCRNPDMDFRGPWCYTVNPRVRWEYCIIDDCDGPYTPLVSFKQALWYPLLGVVGLITIGIIYICLRHRYRKVKQTQPVVSQHTVPTFEIIDEGDIATTSGVKESMMISSTST